MKISKEKKTDRESLVYSLFFVKKMKQKEISEVLNISLSTVKRYVKKYKKDLT